MQADANLLSRQIVLTANLDERAVLIAKFIRLAFVSSLESCRVCLVAADTVP